ncbi:unnamed protein product [Somion occarium]|uniref:Family A G protein-coupled receptor-like protein n=1 Tax=Somion occarium TaxID=3059160 RepID=A0ABP1D9G9_9APHY
MVGLLRYGCVPPDGHCLRHLGKVFIFAFDDATLTFSLLLQRPRGTRLFHQLGIIILTTASLAYFTMASDLGAAPVPVEFRDVGQTRQVFYARYIQWFITFPLVLLQLLLFSGLTIADIITTLYFAGVAVIMGLAGSVVQSTYKWGYYTIGVVSLIYVWYVLLWHAPRTTFPANGVLHSGYYLLAAYLTLILFTYPICWACSEGGNVIHPTSEMIWYGVLDILAGPVFIFIVLYNIYGVDYDIFDFASGKYTDTRRGATQPTGPATTEKGPRPTTEAPAQQT